MEKLIKELRYKASPKSHNTTLDNILAELDSQKSKTAENQPNIWSIIMNNKWTKLSTATVIIAAVMLTMYLFTGSSVTIAQVRNAMDNVNWMQIINEGDTPGDGIREVNWYSFSSQVEIMIDKEGRIRYEDFINNSSLLWNPGSDVITKSTIPDTKEFAMSADSPFDMINKTFNLIQMHNDADFNRSKGSYKDQKVETWTATFKQKNQNTQRMLKIIIDIDKKLPLAATFDHKSPDGTIKHESIIEFNYPSAGPQNIYQAGAPQNLEVK